MDNLASDHNETSEPKNIVVISHNGNIRTDVGLPDTTTAAPTAGSDAEHNLLWAMQKFRPTRGILLALLGALSFTGVDVTVKFATHEVDPFLVLCLYSIVIGLLSTACLLVTGSEPPRTTKQLGLLLFCGGSFSAGATFITLAISKMPVGDAVSILNSMPIFAGVFGWVLLRQALRLIDIFFSILCIIGVTLIARPTFIFHSEESTRADGHGEFIGALCALGSAAFLALSFTTGKILQDVNVRLYYILFTNSCITFTCNALICTISELWAAPNPPYYWAIVLAPGLFEFFAQLAVFWAFRMERAVIVSIILTSQIIFTFALQILFIKITPHWYSAIGAVCIIVTCIGMATRNEGRTEVTV